MWHAASSAMQPRKSGTSSDGYVCADDSSHEVTNSLPSTNYSMAFHTMQCPKSDPFRVPKAVHFESQKRSISSRLFRGGQEMGEHATAAITTSKLPRVWLPRSFVLRSLLDLATVFTTKTYKVQQTQGGLFVFCGVLQPTSRQKFGFFLYCMS